MHKTLYLWSKRVELTLFHLKKQLIEYKIFCSIPHIESNAFKKYLLTENDTQVDIKQRNVMRSNYLYLSHSVKVLSGLNRLPPLDEELLFALCPSEHDDDFLRELRNYCIESASICKSITNLCCCCIH